MNINHYLSQFVADQDWVFPAFMAPRRHHREGLTQEVVNPTLKYAGNIHVSLMSELHARDWLCIEILYSHLQMSATYIIVIP